MQSSQKQCYKTFIRVIQLSCTEIKPGDFELHQNCFMSALQCSILYCFFSRLQFLNKILQHLNLILFYFFILYQLDNPLNKWEETALMTCCTCIMKLIGLTKLALLHSSLHVFFFLTFKARTHQENSDFCSFFLHQKAEVSETMHHYQIQSLHTQSQSDGSVDQNIYLRISKT